MIKISQQLLKTGIFIPEGNFKVNVEKKSNERKAAT